MLAEAQGEMAVLGPGGEPIASMPAADDGEGGIAAMIDIANRTLIYEVRIPLASSDSLPFAVNAAPGSMIGVGFKVGKIGDALDEDPPGERPPQGMPSGGGGMGGPGGGMGGSGGGMGGPGGGMGGPGGPGGAASSQAFEYWAKVRLAAAPATRP